jgi:hypothetical protein
MESTSGSPDSPERLSKELAANQPIRLRTNLSPSSRAGVVNLYTSLFVARHRLPSNDDTSRAARWKDL